jgi:hypothetical protein
MYMYFMDEHIFLTKKLKKLKNKTIILIRKYISNAYNKRRFSIGWEVK